MVTKSKQLTESVKQIRKDILSGTGPALQESIVLDNYYKGNGYLGGGSINLFGSSMISSTLSNKSATFNADSEVFSLEIVFGGDSFYETDRNIMIGEAVVIRRACDGVKITKHKNGGGFKSTTSEVDPRIYLSKSVVCNNSKILPSFSTTSKPKLNTIYITGSEIDNSDVIGRDIIIGDSKVGNNSLIQSQSDIGNSLIDNSTINGGIIHNASLSEKSETQGDIINGVYKKPLIQGPEVSQGETPQLTLSNVKVLNRNDQGYLTQSSVLALRGVVRGLNLENSGINASLVKSSTLRLSDSTSPHMVNSIIDADLSSLEFNGQLNMVDSSLDCWNDLNQYYLCDGDFYSNHISMVESDISGFALNGAIVEMDKGLISNTSYSKLLLKRGSLFGKTTVKDSSSLSSLTVSSGGRLFAPILINSHVFVDRFGSNISVTNSDVDAYSIVTGVQISDSNVHGGGKLRITGDLINSDIFGFPVWKSIGNKNGVYCSNEAVEDANGDTIYLNRFKCVPR
ncbi:MAG: hypothetical protein VXV96_10855 [Bdellovibrionota bacterium]|nr:hypothetical protein [Bdellovibrionota bacterium]